MSMFDSSPATPLVLRADQPLLDEAQLAAAAFLARYSGPTLESYRTDLRQVFQWADNVGLAPLEATRPHIELNRAWMDERGLAASTVDRRLSTICGYYRFRVMAQSALVLGSQDYLLVNPQVNDLTRSESARRNVTA